MYTPSESITPADRSLSSSTKPKQPFLRSGSGLKRRQEASTSEKRYVPRGGFVLDFSESPDTGNQTKKASPTMVSSAKQRKPDAASSRRGEERTSSSQGTASPSGNSRASFRAGSTLSSSKTQQRMETASSGLGGRSGAFRSGSKVTEAESSNSGMRATGRAVVTAAPGDPSARPAAGRQQTARPSMRRPAPSGTTAAVDAARDTPHSTAAEVSFPAHVQSQAGCASAAPGRSAAADSSAVMARPPSWGLSLSEADCEEFGAGVDWDEDAPVLPEQHGHHVMFAPQQNAAEKVGGSVSSSMLSPFVHQLLFGRVEAGGSAAAAHSGGLESKREETGNRQAESRANILKLKAQVEQAAAQLEKDKQAFQQKQFDQAEEMAAWERAKEEEKKKLQRERAVLSKQSRAMLKLPTKKDRAEMEALEATLAEERRTARAKEARHKLIVERLRRQIVELQERNAELREEVHWHEQERLKAWAQQEAATKKKPSAGPKPLAPIPVDSLPEDSTGLSPAAPVDKAVALPSQQVQQTAQYRAEPQTIAQPPATETGAALPPTNAAFLEEQTETAAAAPPMSHPTYNTESSQLAEAPQQQPSGISQSDAEIGAAHAAIANMANVAVHPTSTFTGAPALDLAAFLRRPQRPPAKPLPPVPRFDRCLRTLAQNGYSHANLSADVNFAPSSAVHFGIEFGREAAPGAAGGAGSVAPLRVQVSAVSAPAFHRAALSPFLDDASSEAVYSPLRASMRASAAHHPFSPGGGGFSAAYGALQSSRPAAPHLTRLEQPDLVRFERPVLATGPGLSRASSMRHDAEAIDLSSPARPANEAYNASIYKSWPDAACQPDREAGRLQSGGQVDEATVSTGLQSHRGTMADGVHSALPQHGPAPTHPQQTPMLNGLAQRALEPGTHGGVVNAQAARTGSGHGLAAPGLLAHGSVPVRETRHPDGKVERVFGDGRRATIFPNGTLKEQLADGRSNVCFTNGDVKRTIPDGTVEYFYAEVNTWHTTQPDGVEVFYFPSGQTETHHPSGLKEIQGADGLVRLVNADGSEEDADVSQLSRAAQRKRPSLDSEALNALKMSISTAS
ncbi:probable centromere protein J [Coccomyxa sp. Obi]|nr:probable centromere protein J [Coccomyxa sp. Obi]